MNSFLKKIVLVLVVGVIAAVGYTAKMNSPKQKQREQDYATIERVAAAAGKALRSTSAKDFDKPVQNEWYSFDLSLLYTVPSKKDLYFKFDRKLREELGEDIETSLLSTGEPIVIRLQPTLQEYEIHIGSLCNSNTMVYPYWEYKGLPRK